jgi:hypothetical protein
MNYREKLREWYRVERETNGVVDIKFFPGESRDVPIEKLAEQVYQIVTNEAETVDITDQLR